MMNISMVLFQTMNDSDDDLLSSAVDGLVEDEDWTDTTWAQPVLPAAASSLIKVGHEKTGFLYMRKQRCRSASLHG